MSGGVVCYIERTPGGSGIRRLRLIAAGLVRQWSAPEPRSVSSVDAGAPGSGPSVAAARAGATWIAETLASVGLKRLAAVCVDAEGSICAWLSAPSPEPEVVRATIVQTGAEGDGSGAGIGAARLLTGADGSGADLTMQASLQALATAEPEEPAETKGRRLSLRRSAPVGPVRKQRYAVLAVQDAVVRVLLDELDAKGVEVERVVSIWHAMASSWDRSVPASISDRLVSADPHGAAVILVEPAGRLIWAWTRAGELVAGGTMRLASHAVRSAAPVAPAPEPTDALGTPLGADAARRASPLEPEAEEGGAGSGVLLEFSPAEAGRLAMDWLAWSAQLGHCPQRVVCLAAPNLTDMSSGGGGLGPEALFAHLAKCWPGTTVDGAVHEDPIGATVARLAGLGPEQPRVETSATPAAAAPAPLPYHERPREALVELSARPGRADRRLHQWIGIALCASAFLIAVLGWQIRGSISAANAELAKAGQAYADALKEAEKFSTGITVHPKPVEQLKNALQRAQDQEKALKPPRPILAETVRVLTALKDVNAGAPDPEPAKPGEPPKPANRTVLTELELNAFAATAKLSVPDAATGPTILDKLGTTDGVLVWTGNTQSGFGGGAPGARSYLLTATWPEDLHITKGKPAAKPAEKPAEKPADKPAPLQDTAPAGSPDGPPSATPTAPAPSAPPAPVQPAHNGKS